MRPSGQRAFRPTLSDSLETRSLPSSAGLSAVPAHVVAGDPAPTPTLSRTTYESVMSAIDDAFSRYRDRGVVTAIGHAVDGMLAMFNSLTSPDTPPDGSGTTSSAGDKGNNDLLMQRVSSAILRLPYGGSLWRSIPVDPASITTANSLFYREEIKRQVRSFLRAGLRDGSIVWQGQSPSSAAVLSPAGRLVTLPHGHPVSLSPPKVMTPFRN